MFTETVVWSPQQVKIWNNRIRYHPNFIFYCKSCKKVHNDFKIINLSYMSNLGENNWRIITKCRRCGFELMVDPDNGIHAP